MKDGKYKILTVNPGSTSTKVALFIDQDKVFSASISHNQETLAEFGDISNQLDFRVDTIDKILIENKVDLTGTDAVVGRGGSLLPMPGGTYPVTALLHEHARIAINGVHHPAMLGVQIAKVYADRLGAAVYTVNPPEVDEFQPLARVTGIKGIERASHLHALNLKETAKRHCELNGISYEESNLIVCHIGGGVSVSAHRKGRMVDGNDIAFGSGPMSPTRCGSIPVVDTIELCFSGRPRKDILKLCRSEGGFIDLLGTSDAKTVAELAHQGDETAYKAWYGMIYQISKWIGAMASVLKGEVNGILLGGGIAYSEELVSLVKENCSYIAPIYVYAGEFEMEAMNMGVLRVLDGSEEPMDYDSYIKKYYPESIPEWLK